MDTNILEYSHKSDYTLCNLLTWVLDQSYLQ